MGLREALFLPVIGAICLAAPFAPRIGLYGYLWFGLMRPDLLAFAEGKYPYSLALAVCTGVGAIRYAGNIVSWFRNPFCRLLLLLQVPIGLSVILAIRPELSAERYQTYIRMILVLLLVPVLVSEVRDCRRLLVVAGVSLGCVALKFGLFGVAQGGVDLQSGYGEMLADNNFLALALAMVIPLAWHCRSFSSAWLIRTGWLAVIGAAMAAIVMTGSRGGSLSMLLALALIWNRTKRKLVPLALIAICLGCAISLVQDRYFQRMETLKNVHQEPSAESRLIHANTALKIWSDYPLLGVGFGGFNYAALVPRYVDAGGSVPNHMVHNSYLQMLVDSGILAFLLYCGLLFYAIFWLGRSAARIGCYDAGIAAIPLAIQGPLAVFALGSTFYSCQRMDLPYLFLMAAAAWRSMESQTLSALASQMADMPLDIPPGQERACPVYES